MAIFSQTHKQSPRPFRLGLIAGAGDMPARLLQTWGAEAAFVIAYHGITCPSLTADVAHHWFSSMGQVEGVLEVLHDREISHLVFAGSFPRPSLRTLINLDKKARSFLMGLGLRWPGDDHILQALVTFLQNEGFVINSPQDIMALCTLGESTSNRAQVCVAPLGCWTVAHPTFQAKADEHRGREILAILAPADFGQGLAIQNGLVLGVEAAEGTDACIARCGLLAFSGKDDDRPVYVKRAKPHQSDHMDLPTIGPQTIQALVLAGFQGLFVQADRTLVVDRDHVIAQANAKGLWIAALS